MYFIQDGLGATVLGNDVFGLGCPNKGFRIVVVMLNIRFDSGYQVGDRFKNPASNLLAGQIAEPTFDQVEPGARSRHKMQMESGMAFEPRFDLGTLLGATDCLTQS